MPDSDDTPSEESSPSEENATGPEAEDADDRRGDPVGEAFSPLRTARDALRAILDRSPPDPSNDESSAS